MEDAPPQLAEVLLQCEALRGAVDALREVSRVTVEVEVHSPGLKVKGTVHYLMVEIVFCSVHVFFCFLCAGLGESGTVSRARGVRTLSFVCS